MAAAGEAAGDDLGGGVVDGGAEGAVAEVFEGDDVAGLGVSEGFFNLGGVDPFVAVEDSGARCNNEAGHEWEGRFFTSNSKEEEWVCVGWAGMRLTGGGVWDRCYGLSAMRSENSWLTIVQYE